MDLNYFILQLITFLQSVLIAALSTQSFVDSNNMHAKSFFTIEE